MKKTPLLLLFATLFFSASAKADTDYTYTGNPFTVFYGSTCGIECGLSGTFAVANPLSPSTEQTIAPSMYDFTDGQNTFTNSNSVIEGFEIETSATGSIDGWDISLYDPTLNQDYESQSTFGGGSEDYEYNETYYAYNLNDPGTWTETDPPGPTPEPSSLLLLGTGLLGIAFVMRKQLFA
jgi:hypothetical protein